MEIFGMRVLCVLLVLCFATGRTEWINRRIHFQRLPNNRLEAIIPTTPPSIKTTTANVKERMNAPVDVQQSEPAIQIPRGSEKFAFEILYVS